ncbi:MAG: Ig-like domain-containing protein [Planctomycetota bacterium]
MGFSGMLCDPVRAGSGAIVAVCGLGLLAGVGVVSAIGAQEGADRDVFEPVNCPGSPPTCTDISVTTPEDTFIDINLAFGSVDPDGDPLSFTIFGDPTSGSVTLSPSGVATYVPDDCFNGTDTFEYEVFDGCFTDVCTVTITVTPVNDPPVCNDDSATTSVDTPVEIDVLANDFDKDGDPLETGRIIVDPINGAAAINVSGTITYTPNAGFTGVDTFQYVVTDGEFECAGATVTVTVNP